MILRYVRDTVDVRLYYLKNNSFKLTGYSDNDWYRIDDRKSTSGFTFNVRDIAFR
jgi:hypothetical protein